MWKMLDDINFDCDECGGSSIGPPPKFMIPPPPRPSSFMHQELIKCDDNEMNRSSSGSNNDGSSSSNSNSDINNWNSDMCDAIPILDASYHSSQTLQTSAIIAVFSLLLVLVVLVSSLFVWKHKRKVQNFLPCKTPTRGPHIGNGGNGLTGGHSVTYEDPDAHLGHHRPLVMRHHHQNVEILHQSKTIHYPSGYPMTRSPPLFVCSSPGPDPYRSNDNVYEELGPAHDSDIESEQVQQSDDDFAEDELSLPGERVAFQKTSSPENYQQQTQPQQNIPVSTIYHERGNHTKNPHERNTLLGSSSSSSGQSETPNVRNLVCLSGNNSICSGNSSSNSGGILSGVFRHTIGRNKSLNGSTNNKKINNRNTKNQNNSLPYGDGVNSAKLNRLGSTLQSDTVVPTNYNDSNYNRNSLMTLAYNNSNNNNFQINSNTSCSPSNNHNNNNRQLQHSYNTLENDVERRNRINNQLHKPPPSQSVSTIFHGNDRMNSRYPQPYYTHHHTGLFGIKNHHNHQQLQQQQQQQQQQRSRTNPRSLDRRRIIIPPPEQTTQIDEPNYASYIEPVFHEGLLYAHNEKSNNISSNSSALRQVYPSSYISPDYVSSPFNTLGNKHLHHHHHHHHNQPYQHYHYSSVYNNHEQPNHIQQQNQLYSRDSSFGSDSGYSHHTQTSLTCSGNSGGAVGTDGFKTNGRNGSSSCSGGSTGIITPTTPTLTLPPSDSCGSSSGDINMKLSNSSGGTNFQWNRKQSQQQSKILTNAGNNTSNGINKDNNSISPAITMQSEISSNSDEKFGVGMKGNISSNETSVDGGGMAAINNCSKNINNTSYNNTVNNNNNNNNNNNSQTSNQAKSNNSSINGNSSCNINNNNNINNNSNMKCHSGSIVAASGINTSSQT